MVTKANIIWKDSNGIIRKWIDQKTGEVMEHECEEFLSQCCGAGRHEYVESICNKCLAHTGFECIDCGVMEDEVGEHFKVTFNIHAMPYKQLRNLQTIIEQGVS